MSTKELKDAVEWTFFEAIAIVNDLDAAWEKSGWHFTFAGSVLRNGSSEKDLDIIAFPHDSSKASHGKLWRLLKGHRWKLRIDARQLHDFWRQKGSSDRKHVEVWKTEDGRRVDVFVLK